MTRMGRPPIKPVRWQPAPFPGRARRRTSEVPLPPLRVRHAGGTGPEDVLVDRDGALLTGLADGRVVRLSEDGRPPATVAHTGGRPLGLELMPDGRLLVCDAERGLLAVDPGTGTTETLVTDVDGAQMRFCNNAAVAPDGTVYFSDSSRRFGIEHWKAEMLEHSGTGRLLRRSPSGAVEVLLDGLEFSNGVALSPDGSTVVVAETGASRLTRLHLTGPRQGQAELFADLAAYPDNVSTGSDGLLWVAMPSPRERLQPKPKRMAWVTAWTFDGALVHDLQGAHPDFFMSVGVREHHGTVHLGSLVTANVASFVLPSVPRAA